MEKLGLLIIMITASHRSLWFIIECLLCQAMSKALAIQPGARRGEEKGGSA